MKTVSNIILTAIIFFTAQLEANPIFSGCDLLKANKTAYGKCLDQTIESLDRTLSTWIENQTFKLEAIVHSTGRKTVLKLFKKSQVDFVAFRKNDCRWKYLFISPDKGAVSAYKTCYISLSQNRIDQLEAFNKTK